MGTMLIILVVVFLLAGPALGILSVTQELGSSNVQGEALGICTP
jgi:hypothetical protein